MEGWAPPEVATLARPKLMGPRAQSTTTNSDTNKAQQSRSKKVVVVIPERRRADWGSKMI
jgi:hypothetical protein